MMTNHRPLLWVDDDGRDRFPFEIACLEQSGWQIEWAESAEEAARSLMEEDFDLILLDQVFPFSKGGRRMDVWSGCRLLFWLRGKGVPPGAPRQPEWSKLASRRRPQNSNGEVPVIVISAFQDDHVDAAIKMIEPPPQILPKPVDENMLLELVRCITSQGG